MIKYGKVFKHRRAGQGYFIQQSMITYGKVGHRRAGQGDRLVGSQTKKHCSCQSNHLLSAADYSTFYLFL